jgi:hypothetical protein
MKYSVGFKNGMVIEIDADTVVAAASNQIEFLRGDKFDSEIYVSSHDALFVAPTDKTFIRRGAVSPIPDK